MSNSKQIIDRAWSLAVEYVRQQITEKTKVGIVTDMVNKELENDKGLWIRQAMRELNESVQRQDR